MDNKKETKALDEIVDHTLHGLACFYTQPYIELNYLGDDIGKLTPLKQSIDYFISEAAERELICGKCYSFLDVFGVCNNCNLED